MAESPVQSSNSGSGSAAQPDRGAAKRVLSLVKNIVFFLYLYCGYVALRDFILARLGRARVVVLYYHRISGQGGARDPLTRPLDDFRRDLQYLTSNYECISLSELAERLRAGVPFRRRAAVITFDDGYRDNYTAAVPALMEAGVTATFFVSTGFIGTTRVFPHDIRAAQRDNVALLEYPKLTWDDLRVMEAAHFEIGSHTVNHTNLGVADEETIRHELSDSLAALNSELGARPRAFSFPWGKPDNISQSAAKIVQEVEYYAAASAYGGTNSRGSNPYNIRRVDTGNGHLSQLALHARLAGFDPDYFRLKVRNPNV
jgi:peptidoglycan/xylan/chitin deacetylase (PgdA/CDA1 family)